MDDEQDWIEDTPRIIASGRWEQDENGDTTYIPDHVRPSTAQPAPDDDEQADRDGYRIRSADTWTMARRDYLAGDAAEAVCARYDLKLGTLRSRAAREGWRRCDAGDPDPLIDQPLPADPITPPDLNTMAEQALIRLDQAVRRGRAAEAASWLRTWRALSSVNLADPALLDTPATPDPYARMEQDMREVAAIAREVTAMDLSDLNARAAIEARLNRLTQNANERALAARISDDSDELDSVFSPLSPA